MSEEYSSEVKEDNKTETESDSVTAVDYLERQLELEREALAAMPYEPDTCTYPQSLRQLVFACLTCRSHNDNRDVGVCYSCSIQCHSTHELVELFSRRNFVCDCGTARMKSGSACFIRTNGSEPKHDLPASQVPRMRTGSFSSLSRPFSHRKLPPADDIESSGNTYNQNFEGRFCSCSALYNPISETQTMHQCFLGDVCGEDWFHQECILGYSRGTFSKKGFSGSGENKLDLLSPPEEDAATNAFFKVVSSSKAESEDDAVVPHFPDLDTFDEFVCWNCVEKHRDAFDELCGYSDIVSTKSPHLNNVKSAEEWLSESKALVLATEKMDKDRKEDEHPTKKLKTDFPKHGTSKTSYSVFLAEGFRSRLCGLRNSLEEGSALKELLCTADFLYKDDPIYKPAENDVGSMQASDGSLFDLGSNALSSLPVPQALEGLQAYDKMKDKLRSFFKNFVEQNKVVTEGEVREFFGKMKKDN